MHIQYVIKENNLGIDACDWRNIEVHTKMRHHRLPVLGTAWYFVQVHLPLMTNTGLNKYWQYLSAVLYC